MIAKIIIFRETDGMPTHKSSVFAYFETLFADFERKEH